MNENFDNVFSTLTEIMPSKKVTMVDAKALLLSHKRRLKRKKKTMKLSPLPSVNLSVANSYGRVHSSDAGAGKGKVFDNNTQCIM